MPEVDPQRLAALKAERLPYGPALHNRVVIEGLLVTRSPLHVGSGLPSVSGENATEPGNLAMVLLTAPPAREGHVSRHPFDPSRTGTGDDPNRPLAGCVPFIPGTAIKGVLRAWMEGVLSPFNGPNAEVSSVNGISRALEEIQERQRAGELDEDATVEALRTRLDLVSGLLGCSRWRSKVLFRPARHESPSAGRGARNLLARIPRVAIDAHLGSAEEHKLFEVEFVREDVIFKTRLELRNVRTWELGLLLAALESFNDRDFPTRLGACTGSGYGQLDWKLEEAVVYGELEGVSADGAAPAGGGGMRRKGGRRRRGRPAAAAEPARPDGGRRLLQQWLAALQGGKKPTVSEKTLKQAAIGALASRIDALLGEG